MSERLCGRVTALQIFPEKGAPGILCEIMQVREGLGILGDRHQGPGSRQISILDQDMRKWIDRYTGSGLCLKRYKENIRIDGGLVQRLREGDILEIGTAAIRITGVNKPCFSECPLFFAGENCGLGEACVWAEVIRSGEFSLGEETILRRK